VRFRAVVIPQDVQVEESVRRKVFAPDDAATLDLDAPDRIFGAALRARGISTYDLLPGLRRAAEHERLYKPQDGHWGAAGNRAAADLLARDVFGMR
ncbi:MAG: hypothetical protein QOD06_2306, partial [Candidatus Binatota bacterium]|nr:hypothetical protein [Candidatus Binatota bacterium]